MTALNFPASPTLNQVYTANGSSWIWDGTVWVGGNVTPATSGGTGLTSSGAAGNVLTSDGTGWVSGAAPSGAVEYPQNVQSGNYTLVLADAGKHIYSTNTGAQAITIPTNASVAFPIGTVITIVNKGTNRITFSASGVSVIGNGTGIVFEPFLPINTTLQLMKTGTNEWSATFGYVESGGINYLIIAGGGSGGSTGGGGGGAGGYVIATSAYSAGTRTVTVGAGGAGVGAFSEGNNGANSSVTGQTTAIGGGSGAYGSGVHSGGSGGGASNSVTAGGAGTAGQGFAGGASTNTYIGGGGGGASTAGATSVGTSLTGAGGNGLSSSIAGSPVARAGGGSGGSIYVSTIGTAGSGGGGTGGNGSTAALAGTSNTGGGGGGGGGDGGGNYASGAGGSGVVIISSYTPASATTGSPIITFVNGRTIYQFNSSGTITFP